MKSSFKNTPVFYSKRAAGWKIAALSALAILLGSGIAAAQVGGASGATNAQPVVITPTPAAAPAAETTAPIVTPTPVSPMGGFVGGPVEIGTPSETVETPAPATKAAPAPAKKKAVKKRRKKKKAAPKASNLPASMSYNRSSRNLGSHAVYGSADLPELRSSLNNLFPNENVGLEMVNNNIAVTGTVTDLQTSHRIMEVVDQYSKSRHSGSKPINMMQIKTNQQVMLRVRIGELKRTANKGFGLLTLNALEKDGLFKTLAEPNLVAISGETANFLSGGQFPVPVTDKDGTTIQYKDYGVSLQFTPIVISQNRIRITVESEISGLTKKGSLKSNGFDVPALDSRRAKTTVELAPGESYMIAGLVQDNMNINVGAADGIKEIPILSSLFRDSTNIRNESELVIAVTPYLVDPVKSSDIRLPTDEFHTPSQTETILFGALGSTENKTGVQLQNPGSEPVTDTPFGFLTE